MHHGRTVVLTVGAGPDRLHLQDLNIKAACMPAGSDCICFEAAVHSALLCTGVVVLAASSRPDLLDAALLRPGRLDRLLYCPVPDRPARAAILAALSRNLPMQPGTDVLWLADCTEGVLREVVGGHTGVCSKSRHRTQATATQL